MSLTSMLNGSSQKDKEFQEIFKKRLPLKVEVIDEISSFNVKFGNQY